MYNPIDNLFFDDIARFRFISKTSALYRLKLIIGPNEISFNMVNGKIELLFKSVKLIKPPSDNFKYLFSYR